MWSSVRHLIILVLTFFVVVPAHCYDERRSIALIEDIDRYQRSIGDEFENKFDPLDDHGHIGHDDEGAAGIARFTNEWVVELTGGRAAADNLADEMGYEIVGEVFYIIS